MTSFVYNPGNSYSPTSGFGQRIDPVTGTLEEAKMHKAFKLSVMQVIARVCRGHMSASGLAVALLLASLPAAAQQAAASEPKPETASPSQTGSPYQPIAKPVHGPFSTNTFEKRQADMEQVRIEMGLKRLPVWEMSYAIYRPELAQRFQLPSSPEGEKLPRELLGLEFSVDFDSSLRGYACYLKLYLDSNLPIAYPLDLHAGNKDVFSVATDHFFLRDRNPPLQINDAIARMNEADRSYYQKATGAFFRYSFLSSADETLHLLARGHTHVLKEFNRQLLPNIAYLKVFPGGCSILRKSLEFTKPLELWLKREGSAKDYPWIERGYKDEFITLTLPRHLFEVTSPWIKQIEEYNETFREELRHRKMW